MNRLLRHGIRFTGLKVGYTRTPGLALRALVGLALMLQLCFPIVSSACDMNTQPEMASCPACEPESKAPEPMSCHGDASESSCPANETPGSCCDLTDTNSATGRRAVSTGILAQSTPQLPNLAPTQDLFASTGQSSMDTEPQGADQFLSNAPPDLYLTSFLRL